MQQRINKSEDRSEVQVKTGPKCKCDIFESDEEQRKRVRDEM
jgi:hypothetical protein